MKWLGLALLGALAYGTYTFVNRAPELASAPPAPAAPAQPEPTRPVPAAPSISERLFSNHPMSIAAMRAREYPGSAITVRRTLNPGVNYRRQMVSYQSDGLRINALLTVPNGTPPKGGWPAIVFNHGYIAPEVYRTTERYVAYQDAFARAGFVTLKSDYRGHGDSEGQALGGYTDPGYTTDVLNAAASLRKFKGVNPKRLGMWGHSMGGQLTLRAMVVDPGLRAGVIWAGVVAPYRVLTTEWGAERNGRATPEASESVSNPLNDAFLDAISPNSYLKDLRGPIQLHHGTADAEVPYKFQQDLADGLRKAGVEYQAFKYEGDNHNLSRNLSLALRRSVAFFKQNL